VGVTRTFVVGSRGSRLALRQTQLVLEALQRAHPGASFRVETVRTTGDRLTGVALSRLGGQGVFVKELERALLARKIDIAIHSLKDMPTELSEGLTVAAIITREDVRDVLVSESGLGLQALPAGSTVGTGSPRRAAQVLALRPDLRIAGLRGNVDTRLRKVADGEVDAAVLAAAGLARLGRMERATELLPLEVMLPAVGQGALAVEVREDDAQAQRLVAAVDDRETHLATSAERAFLRRLGGGCQIAVAALGTVEGDRLHLRGLVADTNGQKLLRGQVEGAANEAKALGGELAEELLAQGAADLLATSGVP
jgi:hydroxymethylbilane synthase